WLDATELHDLEPAVIGAAALLSPSTGIVDSHALMLALQGDLEDAGGYVALHSELRGGRRGRSAVHLEVSTEGEITELDAHLVVNAAGLTADRVAAALGGLSNGAVPVLHYAKGNYFAYQGRS